MIQSLYDHHCQTVSDIHEHMPTLKKYASECSHVTEMGVRSVVSTWALLEARPDILRSYDIAEPPAQHMYHAYRWASENNIDFDFRLNDVLKIEIEQTDMLFIDTWHIYDQLKSELAIHPKNVDKYIAFHDTTTFGNVGEPHYDGKTDHKGLMPAINEFLEKNTEWVMHEQFTNNNGLTVIKRK